MTTSYDAVLIVAFGGPEGPDDVMPFLENVVLGRGIPRERLLQVAAHYEQFGGVSPINQQVRGLLRALIAAMNEKGPQLPVYWGNRNWYPLLPDTLAQMAEDGIQHALAFFTSPFSSYSSCRQYLENLEQARNEVDGGAPQVDNLRASYNHPGFIEAMSDRVRAALEQLPEAGRDAARLIYTAHSIPEAMAAGCRYEAQLRESCRLVSESLGRSDGSDWRLVYQSRSGPPQTRWLEPDVCEFLRDSHARDGPGDVVLIPIGFVSDHLEVLYDLDTEAAAVCDELGLRMVRAATVGTHPAFVEMIRLLILERTTDAPVRLALGGDGPAHDVCPADCCPSGRTSTRHA